MLRIRFPSLKKLGKPSNKTNYKTTKQKQQNRAKGRDQSEGAVKGYN